ncbi:MAG: putative S-adenosylmethionine-dependent methyltransferase [Verrucomicrobia bacterium ADurb.Bin345]|nr:MAG: putative S-adenosylmethionine-dependent methyltransferase [Verrucomicrobia bacterium ADurb.Bin345]
MSKLKQAFMERVCRSRSCPRIVFLPNPFKILEFRALMKRVELRRNDAILDVGSGCGLQTAVLARSVARAVGIDVSENAANRARSDYGHIYPDGRLTYQSGTVEEACFPEEAFDKIISICVLEHVADPLALLTECHRITKKGGQIALSVDSLANLPDAEFRKRHSKRYAVHQCYTDAELSALLEKAGYRNIRTQYLGRSPLAARLFRAGLDREYQYRLSESWWQYFLMGLAEMRFKSSSPGVYLLAWGYK